MNFPQRNDLPVKFYYNCLALVTEDITGQTYGRKYYVVTYIDGSESIFLTTNEPDSNYDDPIIDTDFIWIENFEILLNEFEKSELKGIIDTTRFNCPPFFINYHILFIDDLLKPIILKHLTASIGYTGEDFSKNELEHLKRWFAYLSN